MSGKDKAIISKMLKYCATISRHTKDMKRQDFEDDEKTQHACALCIIQIGELSKKLSNETKTKHSHISWRDAQDARNFFAHEYEEVNLKTFWATVSESIPQLQKQLGDIVGWG